MSFGGPPSLEALLNEWWGGSGAGCFSPFANASVATNLVFGTNPPFQVSDFLSFYPKFGKQPQAIVTAIPNALTPGAAYLQGDVLNVAQPDASGGQLTIASVTGNGVPATYTVTTPGTGYVVGTGLQTTGGLGLDALVDITAVSTLTGVTPQAVIQLFINLASASLQQARWGASWLLGMNLFVAHYVTLWLNSEGNPTSTAGQAAISGMGKGIAVQKSAGDVSVGYQPQVDESFTSWNLTSYGQQLVTMAKIIGMGPMYFL